MQEMPLAGLEQGYKDDGWDITRIEWKRGDTLEDHCPKGCPLDKVERSARIVQVNGWDNATGFGFGGFLQLRVCVAHKYARLYYAFREEIEDRQT
jgi:hypothetical protein